MQPGAARRRRCIRLCRILFMSEGAIIHGYLLFPDTGSAGRLLYISRTLGKGSQSLPAFRFRKAGIPKFSAWKIFLPDGPVPIRLPWLTGTFQGHPCPRILKQSENKGLPAFLHSHAGRDWLPTPSCFRQNIHIPPLIPMSVPDSTYGRQ